MSMPFENVLNRKVFINVAPRGLRGYIHLRYILTLCFYEFDTLLINISTFF